MKIHGVSISKKLATWIRDRVHLMQEPNTFMIKGYSAGRLSAPQIAENTLTEIASWVRRNGGDIDLVENTYPIYSLDKHGYYKVVIYSPLCEMVIESIVEESVRLDTDNFAGNNVREVY